MKKIIFTPEQETYIIDKYNKFFSIKDISLELKVNIKIISDFLKSKNLIIRSPGFYNKNKDLNHNYFLNLDTNSLYWLGFIAADGCVRKTAKENNKIRNKNTLHINLKAEDIKHLEKFKEQVNYNNPVKLYKQKNTNGYCRIDINSQELVDSLINYGITPKKSLTLDIKDQRLLESRDFWRGVIDGDGSIFTRKNGNPVISLVSGSLKFITAFKNFCDKFFNQNTEINKIHKNKSDSNCYKFLLSTKKAYLLIKYLYQDSLNYLDRKYKKAMDFLDKFKERY